jgi:hypothetical protein
MNVLVLAVDTEVCWGIQAIVLLMNNLVGSVNP